MEKVYINVYNNANNASVESGFQNFVRTISMLKMCYVMEDQSDEDWNKGIDRSKPANKQLEKLRIRDWIRRIRLFTKTRLMFHCRERERN